MADPKLNRFREKSAGVHRTKNAHHLAFDFMLELREQSRGLRVGRKRTSKRFTSLLFEPLEPRTLLAAEIDVLGNGLSIADGDSSPRAADGTDFSIVDPASGIVTRTFTIRNIGTGSSLGLVGTTPVDLTGSNGQFQVTRQPTGPVAPGGSTTFDIAFNPSTIGTKTATVSIDIRGDNDEDPYNFAIVGLAAQTSPEIEVRGLLSREIVDGDVTPTVLDGTDFGEAQVGTSARKTFSITNLGINRLELLGSPHVKISGDTQNFAVANQPNSSIPRNTTTYFDLDYRPHTAGPHTATIEIRSNDVTGNEDVYTFQIAGFAHHGGIVVTPPDGAPIEDDATTVDLGQFILGSPASPVVFSVRNQGTHDIHVLDPLSDGEPSVPSWVNITDALQQNLFALGSDNFSLQVKTNALGIFGPSLVTFTTDDPVVGSFSFLIRGEVVPPPEPVIIGVAQNGRSVTDNSDTLIQLGSFSVGSNQNTYMPFTVTNHGGSSAILSNLSLPDGLSIIEGLSPMLAAGASDTFTVKVNTSVARTLRGAISFETNDGDPARKVFQINVSAGIALASAGAPGLPGVQVNSPNSGTFSVGDVVTIRGSASHPAGISHDQVELYQGGTTAAHRIGIIYRGTPGEGHRESVTWTVPAVLEGRVLGGRNYQFKWVAWSDEAVPLPAGDYSNGTFNIDASHVAQASFAAPWGSGSFNYYNNRSFFYDNDHLGADILLREGAAVQAGVTGTLKFYGPAPGYGNLVAVIEVDLGATQTFTNAYGNSVTTSKVLWILGHLRKSELNGGGGDVLDWRVGDTVSPTDVIGFIERDLDNGDGAEHVHLGLRLQSYSQAIAIDGGKFARGYEGTTDMGKWFADPTDYLGAQADAPDKPSGFNGHAMGIGAVLLSWQSAPDADNYHLFRSDSVTGPWNQIYFGSLAEYLDTNNNGYHLEPNTTYFYKVVAANAVGSSNDSSVVAVTTATGVLPKPTGLHATNVTSHSVSFAWDDVLSTGSGAYILQASNSPNGVYVNVGTPVVGSTITADARLDLIPGQTYNYRLVASDGIAYSEPTPPIPVNLTGIGSLVQVPSIPIAPIVTDPYDIATVYTFNFSNATWAEQAFGQSDSFWGSKRVIMLTHGWNDRFNKGDLTGEFIEIFARDFFFNHDPYSDLSNYILMAVDWHGPDGVFSPNGSDPNGLGTALDLAMFAQTNGLYNDANISAANGLLVARSLAAKLTRSGINPNNVTLIGHSNGGGFMASLATNLYTPNQKVRELVALDTPVETYAWNAVQVASASVGQVSNYFQSKFSHLDPSISFGAPMYSSVGRIINFQLDNDTSDKLAPSIFQIGHSEVPFRYAHTADNQPHTNAWGFQTSYFMTAETSAPKNSLFVERQMPTRFFLPIPPTEDFSNGFDLQAPSSQVILPQSGQGTIVPLDGGRLKGNGNANLLTLIDASGVASNALAGMAASPVFASVDVVVPANASELEFHLDVYDPGNSDSLLVAIANQIIGVVHLQSTFENGGGDFRFQVGSFAGDTAQLTFYMPSEVPSTANFLVSRLRYIAPQPDISGPRLSVDPPLPAAIVGPLPQIVLRFDEWVDSTVSLAVENFELTGPSGTVSFATIDFDPAYASVHLILSQPTLPEGTYTLTVHGSGITDIYGNRFNDGHDYIYSFTVVEPSHVRGVAWNDDNSDGVRQAGEVPAAGVNIRLFDAATGTQVATDMTDVLGRYEIPGQLSLNYYVAFDLPAGYRFTTAGQGGDDTVDSDVNSVSGRSANFSFTTGGEVRAFDAGLVKIPNENHLDLLVVGASTYGLFGDGMGGFSAASTLGGRREGVAVGDFNEDGAPDVILIDAGSSLATLRFGLGNSQFGNEVSFTAGEAGASIFHAAQADVNNDGHLDLIANGNGSNKVYVHFGQGDGTFAPFAAYAVGNNPRSVAAGDFDGDGRLDLATNNDLSGDVSVLMNLGSGTFAAASAWSTGFSPRGIAVADFNGDGRADIATSNQGSSSVTVRLSLAGGGFGAITSISLPARALTSFDFDGDLDIDLAVADEESNVTILLNNGSGAFAAQSSVHPVAHAFHLAPGDFNGDGRADLAVTDMSSNVANYSSNALAVMYGNGTGGFSSTAYFPVANGAFVYAAELNGTPQFGGIGDFVWNDSDSDGFQDVGEPGLPGITVNLLDAAGSIFATTVTDVVGMYRFPHVPSGDYRLQVVRPDDFKFSPREIAFGTGGRTDIDFGGSDIAADVAIQDDGKVVVVGSKDGDFAVSRLLANGNLDSSFGVNGRVVIDFASAFDGASAVAIQPDGKIVVVGSTGDWSNVSMNFAVTRLTSDGALDTSFDGDGKVITSVSVNRDRATGVLLQPDGKIVVTGYANNTNDSSNVGLVRYLSDGSLDSTFGGTGIVSTAFGGRRIVPFTNAVLQPDGKIVIGADYHVSGGADRHFAVVRFEANGQLDGGFGSQGLATASFAASDLEAGWGGVAVQPDGRILVSGISNLGSENRFALARFNGNGGIDNSFGTAGLVVLDYAGGLDVLNEIRIQSTGSIVGLGVSTTGGGLVRFLPDGSLDTSFGTNGRTDTGINSSLISADAALALRSDGGMVIVGTVNNGANTDFSVKSYSADGRLLAGGNDPAKDSDIEPNSGVTDLFSLAGGANEANIDAGLIPLRIIAGLVWRDQDGDGLRDIGESAEGGVTVQLRSAGGVTLATSATDPQGAYQFSDLPAGDYQIAFGIPSGLRFTLENQGDNDSVDSDPSRATGLSPVITLGPAGDRATIDAGLLELRYLGGRVWDDLNADGRQDLNEPDVAQAVIQAFTAGADTVLGTSDDVLAVATTSDSFGRYNFNGLPGEFYRFVITPPAGLVATVADVGDDADDSDFNAVTRAVTATISGTHEIRELDAGFYRPAKVSGQKWNDLDGDGQHDANEPGLNGWRIELRDVTGDLLDTGITADLDVNGDGAIDSILERGWYFFEGLRPGVYRVGEVQQQGWSQTYPLPDENLLADNFNDNSLDGGKWRVTLPVAGAAVAETGGRMRFANRGYLISQQQFDPSDAGRLRVTGRWQFTNASCCSHDIMQIYTRSDGVPNPFPYETRNGIEFHLNGNNALYISEWFNGNGTVLAGPLAFNVDDNEAFEFEALDDGLHLQFTVTRVLTGETAVLAATSSRHFASNFVVMHNREFNNGNNTLSYLDDFSLTAGGTFYSTILESGAALTNRDFGNQATPGAAPIVDLNGTATGTGFGNTFIENDAPTAAAGLDATITDTDSQFLRTVAVTLTNPADGAAETLDVVTSGTSLVKSYAGGVLTITGPANIADFQQVLRTLRYSNSSENPASGVRTIHVIADDGRHVGTAATVTIDVSSVNDSPTIAAPATAVARQGASRQLPAITVNDADISAVHAIDVTLSVQNGVLELLSGGGLDLISGAYGSSSFTIRGVWPDLNRALSNVLYTSADAFGGNDSLIIVVDDRGQFGPNSALTATASMTIVVNRPPVIAPVAFSVPEHSGTGTVVGAMSATDPDGDAITSWAIVSGNVGNTFAISAGGVVSITNGAAVDFDLNPTFTLFIQAIDNGGVPAPSDPRSVTISIDPETLRVVSAELTSTGAIFTLSDPVDLTSQFNLFDFRDSYGQSVLGLADVSLVGTTNGPITGSLVSENGGARFRFVATDGVLPNDVYTLALRSGGDGFRTMTGEPLDGDNDGVPGGNFSRTFAEFAPQTNVVTVSLPHFARGPSQPVNVPADATLGLPLNISSGANLVSISFELQFDSGLLNVTDITLAAGITGSKSFSLLSPGRAQVTLTFSPPLTGGSQTVAYFTANVPATAANRYGERGVLDLTNIMLTASGAVSIPGIDQDAAHVNAYFGDVSRDGIYNSFDVQQVSRAAVGLDTGYQQHLLLDPRIISDFDGVAGINSFDVQRVSRLAVGLDIPESPALPIPPVTVTSTGNFTAEEPADKPEPPPADPVTTIPDPVATPPAAPPAPKHNAAPGLRSDVDNDGVIDAQDILWAVYLYNQSLKGSPETSDSSSANLFADVNSDNQIDPADILFAVSDFNLRSAGEGEAAAVTLPRTESSDPAEDLDSLAYLLATDLEGVRKKK